MQSLEAVSAFLKKIPFSQHLGIRIESLEKGIARLSLEIKPEFTTSWGSAHGGAILSLLDVTARGTPVRTRIPSPR